MKFLEKLLESFVNWPPPQNMVGDTFLSKSELVELPVLSGSTSQTDVCVVWRRGVVVSGVGLINEVNRHRARLVLGWVTVCGRVNHLGM